MESLLGPTNESFPDVPGVRHRFVDAGGLRMHIAEAGQGEPIVLLHGWPQHWYLWRASLTRRSATSATTPALSANSARSG
jgi:pimeloyl-ACP methyl ester carboxylesterase